MLTKESLARIERFSDVKAILANQHVLVQSLLETRQSQRSVMRWVAGVMATAVAAILLAAIKLRGNYPGPIGVGPQLQSQVGLKVPSQHAAPGRPPTPRMSPPDTRPPATA